MRSKLLKIVGASVALTAVTALSAQAATTIRIQSVLGDKADEIVMLKDFATTVSELTDGEINIEVLPNNSVVAGADILDAVDKGLLDGGFAWTHYWSGKHPAAMLFGSPVAGAGVGIDNIAFLSWFQYGGGRELYDRLWGEMGVAAVAMGGGDILPALEKGTIDAAEWCCPKPDSVFGLSFSTKSGHP